MGGDGRLDALRSVGVALPLDARRELSDCVLLGRPIRTAAPLRELPRLGAITERLGLRYRLSRTSFDLRIDPGMAYWSSNATACSDAAPHAMRFVYLHEDEGVCRAAEAADRADDDCVFGLLLEYPSCCVESFVSWHRRLRRADPIAATIKDLPSDPVVSYDGPSPFSRYLAGGLISHFPCSLRCVPTREAAVRSFHAFATAFPSTQAPLLELERCLTVFQLGQGICAWPRFTVETDRILLDARSAVGDGRLADLLRRVTRIDYAAIRALRAAGVFVGRSTLQEFSATEPPLS